MKLRRSLTAAGASWMTAMTAVAVGHPARRRS